ncbi:hypothetical protein QVD17_39287 [Tagetes erecta]|uniref:F-box protein GID2 n=1 Tax=Tagetes erecta TaxID=13708 RepID=A0AAD8JS28_TARER|nr:hypothetical protein QVD17_39287 [Tagetes erecta]
MKRSMPHSKNPSNNNNTKKIKLSKQDPTPKNTSMNVLLDENLLYEVLKHADERTLGVASCVNKQWHRTAHDERLWELICTKHWTNVACGDDQFRSVVLALGGFRRLHAYYLWPLSKSSCYSSALSSSSNVVTAVSRSVWPCLTPSRTIGVSKPALTKSRWGKDEVQLSLSLLSIRYYEKINLRNENK